MFIGLRGMPTIANDLRHREHRVGVSLFNPPHTPLTSRRTAMDQTTEQQLFEHALLDLLLPPKVPVVKPEVRTAHRGRTKGRRVSERNESPHVAASRPGFPAVVIGQLTTRTIAVRWSDSRSGCYGEQIWRMCHARTNTQCAATGLPIQPGDVVYRPTSGRYEIPFNDGQLILASAAGFPAE
jgi:hypothetical protein